MAHREDRPNLNERLSALADAASDRAAGVAARAARLARGDKVPSEGLELGDLVLARADAPVVIDLSDATRPTRRPQGDSLRRWQQVAEASDPS